MADQPDGTSTPSKGGPIAKARRTASRARSTAAKAQARLERERERRYIVALGFVILDRGRQTAASVLAGALAFRLFLMLLPLSLVAVVGLGLLKSAGGDPSQAVKQFGIKGVLASTINNSASFTDPGRTVVLLLGIVGLLSASRTTAATLRAIHALAWGMKIARWKRSGAAAMIMLGAIILAFVLGGLATRARSDAGTVLGLGASSVLAAIAGALWFGASWLLPHPDNVRWTALLPGSIVVGVGFAALQAVTANWIGPKLQHQTALYGSLAVAFVVLGWLYVVGRLMVAAPLLNAAIRDHGRSWPRPAAQREEALTPATEQTPERQQSS
jgi:uncharacterized BrkB/YihY/UPF0761 family membrane protein